MHIALVTKRTDPARGGAERYTVDLANALVREGHVVSMLATELGHTPPAVQRVPLAARGLTGARRYTSLLDSLDRHLEDARYDIVHAMLPVRHCDVYHPHAGLFRANAAGDSILTRVTNRRRQRLAEVERSLLERPNPPMVLCLSEYVRRSVHAWYTLSDDRLPILFNAVDLAKFDPAASAVSRDEARRSFGIRPGQCVALFVGHDFERKGLREAVLATADLVRGANAPPASHLVLLVAGRAHATHYTALARQLGVGDHVVLAGHVDDAYRLYRAADFLVLPTRHDPCSLVVLEALAMGVPVISTRRNGACEIMDDGTHGFVLADPADVGALRAAMGQLLDPDRRAAMGRACLQLRPRLSYDRHLETLVSIYQSVAASRAA